MGFLDFLGGGGSGLITGLTGTIAGAISSSKDRDLQRQLQQQQMEYGREMYAIQSKDEKERMEQQNEWNKERIAKGQQPPGGEANKKDTAQGGASNDAGQPT